MSYYRNVAVLLIVMLVLTTTTFGMSLSLEDVKSAISDVLEAKPLPTDCDAAAASEFMLEVAVVESAVIVENEVFFQEGSGPDYGPFQINIATAMSVLSKSNPEEVFQITGFVFSRETSKTAVIAELKKSAILGAYVFREKYGHRSFREADGSRSKVWTGEATLKERAFWWKQHYNTHLGAGTPEKYLTRVKFFLSK